MFLNSFIITELRQQQKKNRHKKLFVDDQNTMTAYLILFCKLRLQHQSRQMIYDTHRLHIKASPAPWLIPLPLHNAKKTGKHFFLRGEHRVRT